MNIVVDHQPLAAERLGLRTVGQMLAHLRKDNRLVVHLLVDGEAPDLDRMGELRQLPLSGHSVFVETADPAAMALEVLEALAEQLRSAEALKEQAVELLRSDQWAPAMQKLTGCFGTWQHAQDALGKTARLLAVDLALVRIREHSLQQMLGQFGADLREIRAALENRDFVRLGDALCYGMGETTAQWLEAIDALRGLSRR